MSRRIVPPSFQNVTIPADTVTLHRWVWPWEDDTAPERRAAGEFGEQIGEPIAAGDEPVTFPPHRGDPGSVHCVAWHQGRAMYWTDPAFVAPGDEFVMTLPIVGDLHLG